MGVCSRASHYPSELVYTNAGYGDNNTIEISQDISAVHDRKPTHASLSKKGDVGFFLLHVIGERRLRTSRDSHSIIRILSLSPSTLHPPLTSPLPSFSTDQMVLGFLYPCLAAPLKKRASLPASLYQGL